MLVLPSQHDRSAFHSSASKHMEGSMRYAIYGSLVFVLSAVMSAAGLGA